MTIYDLPTSIGGVFSLAIAIFVILLKQAVQMFPAFVPFDVALDMGHNAPYNQCQKGCEADDEKPNGCDSFKVDVFHRTRF